MAGAGYRTFASGEVLTSTNVQTYLMDQAVQVYSGTAARASAVPSPSTGMVAYSTATGLQVFNGSAWTTVGGATYASITGGASTALGTAIGDSTYNIHTFTSDANLVVTTAGLVDALLVAGGGGGGSPVSGGGGGGGGAGGVIQSTLYLAAGTYAVDIGAGGSGTDNNVGACTSINTTALGFSAAGGGGGGTYINNTNRSGGSGGGAPGYTNSASIGRSIALDIQGKNGGDKTGGGSYGAGGGGGFTATGSNGTTNTGGAGGAGYDVSAFIGGSALYKAGGGGGNGATTGGAGGSSVGGAGGNGSANGTAAGANTGSGGGGAGQAFSGGAGGSGIAYIRVKTS